MSSTLTEGNCSNVQYTNSSTGEVTKRTVIPTFIPKDIVKVIDVTSLEENDQEEMATMVSEYNAYLTAHMNTAFNFESWVEQTKSSQVEPKWRTFKMTNLVTLG